MALPIKKDQLLIKELGFVEYEKVWQSMQDFTQARDQNTPDELWVVEHPPVFTLGRSGKTEHILCDSEIPVIKVDRGGQVTYHGPGQIVIYLLLDLHRRNLGIRKLVTFNRRLYCGFVRAIRYFCYK